VGVGDNNDLPLMTEAIGEVSKQKNKTKRNKTVARFQKRKVCREMDRQYCPFRRRVRRTGSELLPPFFCVRALFAGDEAAHRRVVAKVRPIKTKSIFD
jgi:hypothetical protein